MKMIIAFIMAFCATSSSYCAASEGLTTWAASGAEKAAVPETPAPSPAGSEAPKEWTVMVFMNAKNDLEAAGLKDFNEMEAAGSTDRVSVVVEIGRIKGFDSSDGDWKGVRRYLVSRDSNPAAITSPLLADLGRRDMGDWRTLADFGRWAKAAYPAKRYILIVWNHGTGWSKLAGSGPLKAISEDQETGHTISTPELGSALREMGGVDLYASDACLMQMAEVAYELKDQAAFVAGSEETEPLDGYTYDDLFGRLAADPGMSAEALGRAVVDSYAAHYQALGKGATQSLIRTAAFPGFIAALDAFTTALTAAGDKGAVNSARAMAQSYGVYRNSKDLWHFADLAASYSADPAVKAAAGALKKYISEELVAANAAVTPKYADAHGVAVAMHAFSHPAYAPLAFARGSRWDEFIEWYRP